MNNIHERIGWFRCANLRCRKELGTDHVTVISTTRVRRFCSYLCIAGGMEAWMDHLAATPNDPDAGDLREQYDDWSRRVWESIPGATPVKEK